MGKKLIVLFAVLAMILLAVKVSALGVTPGRTT